ncbi:MAG: prepilin-type N-terminal cleavage/methylation domain-containing protein, partial [Pyrinomonadaceae bacterium]
MRYHKTTTTTTQRKPRSLSRTQTGFSLLELLISMAITVIAVIAAVGLMTKFARTVGAFTEVST